MIQSSKQKKSKLFYLLTTIMLISLVFISNSLNTQILEPYREKILEQGKVVKVVEIISPVEIIVNEDGEEYKIKLLNTYAPKSKDILKKAKMETQRFILGDEVHLIYDETKKDNQDTSIALVYYANANYLLNASLIDRGYAEYRDTYPCWLDSELALLEIKAKKDNKGMWKNYTVTEEELKEEELLKKDKISPDDMPLQDTATTSEKETETVREKETYLDEEEMEVETAEIEEEDINVETSEDKDVDEGIEEYEDEGSIEEDTNYSIEEEKVDEEVDDSIIDDSIIDDSIEEIINDNYYLDVEKLINQKNDKGINGKVDILSEEYKDWATLAFSIDLKNLSMTDDYLENFYDIDLYRILEKDLTPFINSVFITGTEKLQGVASNMNNEFLLYLYGNYESIVNEEFSLNQYTEQVYKGIPYFSSKNLSFFVFQDNNIIIVGSDKGVKYFIQNVYPQVDISQYDIKEEPYNKILFEKTLEQFSISKPIHNLSISQSKNWFYIDLWEELREELFLSVNPVMDEVEGLYFNYDINPMEEESSLTHTLKLTLMTEKIEAIANLESALSEFITMLGTLGSASPTFVNIMNNIGMTQQNNMLSLSISFTNTDLMNINNEIENPYSINSSYDEEDDEDDIDNNNEDDEDGE